MSYPERVLNMSDKAWASEHTMLMRFAQTEKQLREMYKLPSDGRTTRYEGALQRFEHAAVLTELARARKARGCTHPDSEPCFTPPVSVKGYRGHYNSRP